jgi:arylsulfatase A-like enzyme
LPARQLGANAALRTYWGWLTEEDPTVEVAGADSFTGYDPPILVTRRDLEALAAATRKPNIVMLVWESTRYDFTSLAGKDAPAHTPNLTALAARGVVAPTARAVMPHTSKSLVSMLCARFPPMQKETIEVTVPFELQCLPWVLTAAGYRTAFFQSALGTFEQRPRLVDKLGYTHFEAWEEIGGHPLGYLASDDASLAAPLARWIDGRAPNQPFFATVLTSSTHHPYRLPDEVAARAARTGAPVATARDRYARLVEHEDELLGQVVDLLQARGLLDSTIVVVLGDHGEGFGDKGVRQHDANFYEEGLRVPFVLAGPGLPHRRIDGNVSLIDLTPTLLGVLGLRVFDRVPRELTGHDLLAGLPDEPRYFGCWYEHRCRGFVLGTRKVVEIPQTGQRFYFDLAADPGEERPRSLPEDLRALVPRLDHLVESHRARRWPMVYGPTRPYGDWRCEPNRACTNPRTPPGGFFEPP